MGGGKGRGGGGGGKGRGGKGRGGKGRGGEGYALQVKCPLGGEGLVNFLYGVSDVCFDTCTNHRCVSVNPYD